MKLIFFRHGIAADKKSNQSMLEDFRRELIHEGSAETLKMLNTYKEILKHVDTIFSSPLLRAVQTAEIISEYFPQIEFELLPSLDTLIDSETLIQIIKKFKPSGSYIFVGHEPQLSETISKILGLNINIIELKKSGFAILKGHSFSDLKLTFLASPDLTVI